MSTIEHKSDFNSLVVSCAGATREEQESYLVRLVMKLMIERYGRGESFPDVNVLCKNGIDGVTLENAMKVLDGYYLAVSRSLLDDADDDPCGVRSAAEEYMRSELQQRREIQREAEV